MSYMQNALLFLENKGPPAAKREIPKSKADFSQALRILGARVLRGYVCYDASAARPVEIARIFLNCSLADWSRVFGRPQDISDHADQATNMHTQTWRQHCEDGTIVCIGNLFDREPGGPWVILSRVWFS